jgi:hypothetical protein
MPSFYRKTWRAAFSRIHRFFTDWTLRARIDESATGFIISRSLGYSQRETMNILSYSFGSDSLQKWIA